MPFFFFLFFSFFLSLLAYVLSRVGVVDGLAVLLMMCSVGYFGGLSSIYNWKDNG